jgi:hypothetical protein
MYDVQLIAADGFTRWIRVRATSESRACALAVKAAREEYGRGRTFYPAAVLAR